MKRYKKKMKIKDKIKKLEKSQKFLKWKKDNPDSYLVHVFAMLGDGDDKWQIGYYDKKRDKITSFVIGEKTEIIPESDIFKKEKTKISKLNIGKVKVDFSKANELTNSFQREKYPNETPIKKIFVLQNVENNQLWNITFVSKQFNTLNMKLDAETGKIRKQELVSLFKLGKQT